MITVLIVLMAVASLLTSFFSGFAIGLQIAKDIIQESYERFLIPKQRGD